MPAKSTRKPFRPPLLPPPPPQIRSRRAPGDMSRFKLSRDGVEMLERQSLEIFTMMANSGRSFAECLSSILLTGIQWGQALTKEETES